MKKKYTLKRNTYAWLYPWIISILLIQSAALFSSTGPNRNNDRNHHIICFNVYLNAKEIYELPSYIFEELIQKGDRLTLYIAQKKYHFPPQLLRTQPKEKFISFVLSRIKTDLNPYWVKYKTIQDQMAHLIHQLDKLSSNITFRNTFWAYGQLKKELAGNRQLTTEGLNQMIQYSNRYPEKAKIWIIFQKEFKLIPAKDMMDHMRSDNNLKFESIDAFMNETSGIAKEKTVPDSVNLKGNRKPDIHFIYYNPKIRNRPGSRHREFSGDLYHVYAAYAKTSGGKTITAPNPSKAIRQILTTTAR